MTTVRVPAGTAPDAPLVSYQPFVNALGLQCAPSHQLFELPGADHGTAMAGAAGASGYLGDRFAGVPAPSNC
ncbi:hypothetical protein [Rhodococcus sp. NPDC058521]|uniref:hypothetical protein n=1 Tax=Rhodococcus sp. NPDC058521 TaxID=3346536 RepID=UPI003667ED0B